MIKKSHTFSETSFEALKMGPFPLFSKYKQKLPFCNTFRPPEKVKKGEFNGHQSFFHQEAMRKN